MRSFAGASILLLGLALTACSAANPPDPRVSTAGPALAQIYFWRARPGMLEAYNRYIREVAEPIDRAAREQGAFVSVTTYVTQDTATAWTHMRVFVLRDSAQLAGLGAALDAAGKRLEPDSGKRQARSEYAATLRDRVGSTTASLLP